MLTVQWQPLTPYLGAGVPDELAGAGVADDYARALEASHAEYERIAALGRPELAPYALCLGYRIRYVIDMNARAAMHLIELRSGREGHPSYRAVAHALHAEIARVHPAVAAAMTHVDRDTEPRLERILSEIRTQAKAAARPLDPASAATAVSCSRCRRARTRTRRRARRARRRPPPLRSATPPMARTHRLRLPISSAPALITAPIISAPSSGPAASTSTSRTS